MKLSLSTDGEDLNNQQQSGCNVDPSASAISTAEQYYGIYSLFVTSLSGGLTTWSVSHR